MTHLSYNSERLYAAAVLAFHDWRRSQGLPMMPKPREIARYLQHVRRKRGPSAVPVHLSAVARCYRETGSGLDTKSDVIQAVVKRARREMSAAAQTLAVDLNRKEMTSA